MTQSIEEQAAPRKMSLGPVMLDVAGLQLSEDDQQRLLHPLVGGVILFARNFVDRDQVTGLIGAIKRLREPALLVAVDQEGGRVQRFKNGFSELPPAASFGEAWDRNKHTAPIHAYESARLMASELLAVGIDFSFAPVFDVNSQANEVIGNRSFHANPAVATELLGAYIDGMHSVGMICVAKHFPGHGGVSGDSHACLPVDARARTELDQHDLWPYRELVEELDAVMTAHVLFESCDANIPTFSKYWIQAVLRDQLGFTGVVFSDDLTMQGAIDSLQDYSVVRQAEQALAAGCDMLLVCNRPDIADELLHGLDYTLTEKLSGRLQRLSALREPTSLLNMA